MIDTATTQISAAADWHCPPWCPVDETEHARDSEEIDHGAGAAIHRLDMRVGIGLPRLAVLLETEPSGKGTGVVLVGDEYELPPATARRLADMLNAAATLAELS